MNRIEICFSQSLGLYWKASRWFFLAQCLVYLFCHVLRDLSRPEPATVLWIQLLKGSAQPKQKRLHARKTHWAVQHLHRISRPGQWISTLGKDYQHDNAHRTPSGSMGQKYRLCSLHEHPRYKGLSLSCREEKIIIRNRVKEGHYFQRTRHVSIIRGAQSPLRSLPDALQVIVSIRISKGAFIQNSCRNMYITHSLFQAYVWTATDARRTWCTYSVPNSRIIGF